MLRICGSFKELNVDSLLAVYRESIEDMRDSFSGRYIVEDDFIAYLRDDFFKNHDSFYGILLEDGEYVSAVRIEPYGDGWLLSGIETAPNFRRQGFAAELIRQVLAFVRTMDHRPVYSHVRKDNRVSLELHKKVGFITYRGHGKLIDGTVSNRYFTLVKRETPLE